MSTEPFSDDEITAFGQKLEEWGASLSDREQVLLLELVSRANEATNEVEGFSFGLVGGATLDAGSPGTTSIEPGDQFRTGQFGTMTRSALGGVSGLGIIIVDC